MEGLRLHDIDDIIQTKLYNIHLTTMEFAQKTLGEKAMSTANPLVLQLVDQLDAAIVPRSSNVGTNRKLWDTYCREWTASADWVQKMAEQVGMAADLQTLGDEWSSRREKDEILHEFIYPYISEFSRVAEVGVGGGNTDYNTCSIILTMSSFLVSCRSFGKGSRWQSLRAALLRCVREHADSDALYSRRLT